MNKSGVPIYIKLSTSKLLSSPSPFFSTTRRNLLQSFHAGLASFLLFYLLTKQKKMGHQLHVDEAAGAAGIASEENLKEEK